MVRVFACFLLIAACETGGLPQGWAETPAGSGPQIIWDLNHEPLPEIPLPNDVATWPDPTSRTGRRINVSLVAPTQFEVQTRDNFDQVDGWGTFQAISMAFDQDVDIRRLFDAQGGGSDAFAESEFAEHAVYLVDMETGAPMPLDLNSGNFHYVLDSPDQFWRNDPHAGESNLIFETHDEDVNGNGVLDPGEDIDFDGVLDEPNTWDGTISDPLDTVDNVPWFWERETKTLIVRPILPLRPMRTYAVVVTDRLKGTDGQAVRSPFDIVHPVTQTDALERLPDHFSNHAGTYGDLATRGWEGVAFAWTFTTQSITEDIDTIRAGMYGEGSMAYLREDFSNNYAIGEMQGGRRCEVEGNRFVAPAEAFLAALNNITSLALGLNAAQSALVLDSYSNLSHIVVTFYDTPYFLGDPATTGLEDSFIMDSQTGEARIDRETIAQITFIPKESAEQQQPFDVAYYVHGHGSFSAEPIPFAGFMMKNGVAVNVLNAEGHGVPLDPALGAVIRGVFETDCLGPAGDALLTGRAEDLDGDGEPDSGGDFYSAYLFHTRDTIRQTVIDHMRSVQILRSFDGRLANPKRFENGAMGDPVDYDADIHAYEGLDVAGDFDGNGVPDIGGPDAKFLFTGGSLGGIVTGVMAGAEPSLRAAAPIVGAGGLSDVAMRLDLGGVLSAVHLRMMGPFVITEPAPSRGDRSRCEDSETAMYILANDVTSRSEMEIACFPAGILDSNDVMIVRNLANDEVTCGGAVGGEAGRYRVNFPADAEDPISVEIYADALLLTDFGTCTIEGDPAPTDVVDSFRRIARYQDRLFEIGEPLITPAMGFGNPRQTPDLRRLLMLAQAGFEPADPINFARRVFLEPVGAADAPAVPTNLLAAASIGDQSVPLSAGNAYARAAGVLPFLPPDAPDSLAEWRAPTWFAETYPGMNSPNDVLIEFHVLEGVDRLNRHPLPGAANFLFDVDDLSDGRIRFNSDGQMSSEPDAFQPPRLDPPLRWVRQTRRTEDAVGDVWSVLPGDDVSAFLNSYANPRGVHGFDDLVYDQELPWDPAQYLINLIARWGATGGQDLQYHSSPNGHRCLEDSTCDFLIGGE